MNTRLERGLSNAPESTLIGDVDFESLAANIPGRIDRNDGGTIRSIGFNSRATLVLQGSTREFEPAPFFIIRMGRNRGTDERSSNVEIPVNRSAVISEWGETVFVNPPEVDEFYEGHPRSVVSYFSIKNSAATVSFVSEDLAGLEVATGSSMAMGIVKAARMLEQSLAVSGA